MLARSQADSQVSEDDSKPNRDRPASRLCQRSGHFDIDRSTPTGKLFAGNTIVDVSLCLPIHISADERLESPPNRRVDLPFVGPDGKL